MKKNIYFTDLYTHCTQFLSVSFFSLHLVGSIIMASDKDNHYLVTGDVDGLVKSWDISEYCVKGQEDLVTKPPREYNTTQIHVLENIAKDVNNKSSLLKDEEDPFLNKLFITPLIHQKIVFSHFFHTHTLVIRE